MTRTPHAFAGPVATLRRFAKKPTLGERCDFCSLPLAPEHRHLLELSVRKVVCVCAPCALRFENVEGGRFRLIPREARRLDGLKLEDALWEELAIPIRLAFVFFRTPPGKMTALYPSPAGVTESLLPLTAWPEITREHPILETLQPDVEALLVNQVAHANEAFITPIDACFELAGLIRLHWRGFTGGEAVWREIERFFSTLRAKAELAPRRELEVRHA